MGTWLLDTCILIDVLNGKRGRKEAIGQLIRQGAETACCSINVTEVFAGVRGGEEEATGRFLRSLRWFEVSWAVAKLAGEQQAYWRREGRTVSLPDATIAAVAIANDLVLVTANVKDFPMKGLKLYKMG